MNPIKTKNCAAAVLLLGALAAATQADVLVSNLLEPLRAFNVLNATDWATQSFQTDANAYSLTSIEVIVGNHNELGVPFAQLIASDMDGNLDTSPGALIATFTVPDLTGPREARTFIPDSAVILEPSTIYYFVLGAKGDASFEWSYAEGDATVGPGILYQYEYTYDSGAIWTLFGAENPFHTQVNVDAAPPPLCEGDADHDGDRDFPDVTSVLANWGTTYAPGEVGAGDANGDAQVDFTDITSVLRFFAIPCP